MARCSVVPGNEGWAVVAERAEGILGRDFVLQHQPGADQIHGVGATMPMCTTVVVNGFVLVPRVREFRVQHLTKAIQMTEV